MEEKEIHIEEPVIVTDPLEGIDLTRIVHRVADGSYVVQRNGLPFHVPNEGAYADLWNHVDEYAKAHPEVITEEYPYVPGIEELRTAKLDALNSAFTSVESDAWVQSSLGFKADANTTANTNIDGLIKSMTATGSETTLFCDYDNVFRAVTLDNLKTLQLEVIQNGQNLYAQKWAFREAINAAKSKEELDAVVIAFTMMDFTA